MSITIFTRISFLTVFISILIISTQSMYGQVTCGSPNSTYYLSNQAAVDNFPATYGGCTTLLGSLRIQYNVQNLDSLKDLTSIGKDLYIKTSNVINDISGLSNITSIGRNLKIYSLDLIENIDALQSITTIGDDLFIEDNDLLSNILGLGALNSLGGDLSIQDNPELKNLDGLNGIQSLSGYVQISTNNKMLHIDGLESISSVGNWFSISYNDTLRDVDGLSSLVTSETMSIYGNENLVNVDGLSSLHSTASHLVISDNALLSNIDGLDGLTSVGGLLKIEGNDALVNIDGLKNVSSVSSSLYVNYNDILGANGVSEFCGLYTLLSSSSGLSGSYSVNYNAYNPTQTEIVNNGDCPIPVYYSIGSNTYTTLSNAIAAGSPIDLIGNATETASINLPVNTILNIPSPHTLVFSGSATIFTNFGTVNNNGSFFLLNEAKFTNQGTLINDGIMKISNGN